MPVTVPTQEFIITTTPRCLRGIVSAMTAVHTGVKIVCPTLQTTRLIYSAAVALPFSL